MTVEYDDLRNYDIRKGDLVIIVEPSNSHGLSSCKSFPEIKIAGVFDEFGGPNLTTQFWMKEGTTYRLSKDVWSKTDVTRYVVFAREIYLYKDGSISKLVNKRESGV
ncbi:MAG: hypothetical protein Q7S74_03700 [Nanoarchaeota archaeon]|nr:hypothetical protein [Nanoarchaeota archaeon]